ncbi:hypothetical protein MSIMFB_01243 [Mycobacterium simulans]|uniref:Transposase IS110-like N-terminal domain-containing protein n=1 Tax=Mycobacterium simulans TaxID=627089 RepID=A0A7Z7N8K9_9MYCO|nr:IS110 family transposase [Mycobacterium simulans]SOJ53744.1 hypothetical protein MSIMFB_01243 [Mycobacterium simulans]
MPTLDSHQDLSLYCGIDWATYHHDVAVVDNVGRVVLCGRLSNDGAGFPQLLTLLAQAGDSPHHLIPVASEIDRELWVTDLLATGRVIYPTNPLASSRYHTSHAVSGAKSDATDPVLLANILRIDPAAHRSLRAATEPAEGIGVLARAVQDAVWARQQTGNQIRDLLRDFYPAAIAAFAEPLQGGLARRDVRIILAAAPTPTRAAALTPTRLRHLLVTAGRQYHLDRDAERLRQIFTDSYLHKPPEVETAMGIRLAALLGQLEAACTAVDELVEEAMAQFG